LVGKLGEIKIKFFMVFFDSSFLGCPLSLCGANSFRHRRRDAISLTEGGFTVRIGSLLEGNGDDRCLWQKQGEAVGAAASKMQALAKRMLGAATRR